jgi:hypothetical protein
VQKVQRGRIGRVIVECERADHEENLEHDRHVEDPRRGHHEYGHVGATGPHRSRQLPGVRACASIVLRLESDSIDPHRVGDVLDGLLAQVLGANHQLVSHLLPDRPRHADSTRFGQALEARRDVDAFTVDAVPVEHDVAEVEPDAEF